MNRIFFSVAIISIGLLFISGCATKLIYKPAELEQEISKRLGVSREEAGALVPFAPTPEIDKMGRRIAMDTASTEQRVDFILQSILSSDGLNVVYKKGASLTAYQVLVQRSANCIAFTNLFVAIAREAGLDAIFVDVTERISFEYDDFQNYQAGHICAGIRKPGSDVDARNVMLVDFVYRTKKYKRFRVISDLEAIANYMTLLGVQHDREYLRTGNKLEEKKAIDFHLSSLLLAPKFTRAMNNLAAIYMRNGKYDVAEQLLKLALATDEDMITARYNLAELYIRKGDIQEAKVLLNDNLNRYGRDPYSHYRLGQVYFSTGETELAAIHLRRAINLKETMIGPRLSLLSLLISSNKRSEAERLLGETEKLFPSNKDVSAYRQILEKDNLKLLP